MPDIPSARRRIIRAWNLGPKPAQLQPEISSISTSGLLLDLASNDYLGMSNNYELQEALSESCKKNGLGSGSSPLISGYSESHKELE